MLKLDENACAYSTFESKSNSALYVENKLLQEINNEAIELSKHVNIMHVVQLLAMYYNMKTLECCIEAKLIKLNLF